MSEPVIVDIAGGVETVQINRPERRNALSPEVVEGLLAALADARTNPDVRVVVITGVGDKAFCAGGDLAGSVPTTFIESHETSRRAAGLFQAAYGVGKPTIAKVRGYALAGGFGLALSCDLVIASESATFGTPEINVGMWPMMITVPMLRSMPPKVALELQMTGRRLPATEARELGFVTRVVPDDELDATVDDIASVLASKPASVMKLGRDAFYRVLDQPVDDALALLHASLILVQQTEDHAEGMAAFKEKRPPVWTGR